MRDIGLYPKNTKKFKSKTTDSNHDGQFSPRIFKSEEYIGKAPNEIWAGDITYLPAGGKFYYLSVVLDLFNREVIGWSLDKSLSADGVITALKNAILSQGSDSKIIFHSDRGVQYSSKRFRTLLNGQEMIPSMSRKGNCYDNCYVESFFKILKTEIFNMNIILTEKNIHTEIFRYIEVWYNRRRMHSSLSYKSPLDFKRERIKGDGRACPEGAEAGCEGPIVHQPWMGGSSLLDKRKKIAYFS